MLHPFVTAPATIDDRIHNAELLERWQRGSVHHIVLDHLNASTDEERADAQHRYEDAQRGEAEARAEVARLTRVKVRAENPATHN